MFSLLIRRFSKRAGKSHPPRAVLAATAAALAALGFNAGPAAAATYQVPSSIAADCSVDVTSPLLSWIASVPDYSTLSFGTNACYRIEGTLDFSGRHGLDFEGNGSTFRSINAPTDTRAIWRAWQSTGLIFRNMTITGSYPNGGTFTSTLQHAHGIDLRGTGAEIADVAVSNVGGDCVYFGLGSDNSTRSTGSLHNSTCTGTSRNAVSVTAGSNVLVQYVTTSSIGYDVFDVEPNTGTANWGADNITFDSNTIDAPYALSAFSVVPNAPLSALSFTHNTVVGRGLKITTGSTTTAANRPQGVTITGNSSDSAQAPAAMNISSVDGLTITGNTVPLTSGAMASVDSSCSVNVASNSYPGGTSQYSIAAYTCSPPTPTTTPTVLITSPASGAILSGPRTTVAATASSGAVKMAVYVDGALLSTSATNSISTMWNLKKVGGGSHTITVDAWNSSNSMGASAVTVYK
jgi:hypothetical protein